MSIAANNVKVFLFEKYCEHKADELNIHINDLKELIRADVFRGLEELKEKGYIIYKKTSRDYCNVSLLSAFFEEYNIRIK